MAQKVIAFDYLYKEVTLKLDASIYAVNDVLSATREIATVFEAGRPVELCYLAVLDKDDQAGILDIVLLRSNVSIGAENGQVSISDADADEILTIVSVVAANYDDLLTSQFAVLAPTTAGMGAILSPAAGTSLYIAAISRDTKTYTAAGITLKLGFRRP